MSDLPPDDATPTDGARPKRPPPTLDLSATEIPHAEAAAGKPDEAKAARRPSRVLIPALTGAIAGALVAGAAFLAQWPVGSPPEPAPAAAPAADKAALDEIRARVAKLEARPAAAADPDPATQRLDALDRNVAALRAENEALRAQAAQAQAAFSEAKPAAPAPAAAPTDLGPIDARLTQIETAQRAQADKAAEQTRRPTAEPALRQAIVATQLDALVRQGEPYAATLAAAKPLAADAAALRPLDAFAVSGVPTAATLAAELLAIPQIAPAPETATSGGLIERMRAGATKLVKIERTDANPTDNAAIGRATAAARRADAATAVRELATLPANDRVAVQPWLDRATAADAARTAARQFAEQAIAAAAKTAP